MPGNAVSQVEKMRRGWALAEATSDLKKGKSNLDEVGYTIHPNFVPTEMLAALRERLQEQADMERAQGVATVSDFGHAGADRRLDSTGGLPVHQTVTFLPNKGKVFRDLMMSPIAAEYCRHVFQDVPYNLATQNALLMRCGGKQQIVHVDQQAWPFLTPIPVMLNVMFLLSDFDADMGATCVMPESHCGPPPEISGPTQDANGIGMIPMTAKAGSAVIWESRTWHCQGNHNSTKTRMSIGSVYAVHFAKPQELFSAAIHDDVYETLTDAEKEMLGFKVVYEYGGRIGPRSPDDRRSNTNGGSPYIPELSRANGARSIRTADMAVPISDRLPVLVDGTKPNAVT